MKRALILDLDNTIYPVSSIAGYLFNQLFTLLDENPDSLETGLLLKAKDELQRRPYHLVADKYNFSPEIKTRGNDLLKDLSYTLPMTPFSDYAAVKSIPLPKFLVTTGYSNLQWSKVKMLGIEDDFEEIHIVDPEKSTQTKKDVFADILQRHAYAANEVLVIGDDPESEIKAAAQLGIDTFLFDPENRHPEVVVTHKSAQLKEVVNLILV